MFVIFHIDENKKWDVLISNVQNLSFWLKDNKKAGEIEVLINGEAVERALSSSSIDLSGLINLGVRVVVCNNSLDLRGYKKEQLQKHLDVVPFGIVELVKKQELGYNYIKP